MCFPIELELVDHWRPTRAAIECTDTTSLFSVVVEAGLDYYAIAVAAVAVVAQLQLQQRHSSTVDTDRRTCAVSCSS